MIKCYNKPDHIDHAMFQSYVNETTIATGHTAVTFHIEQYLSRPELTPEVRQFCLEYLNTPELMAKTRIVSDGSWRNCVILVRPDRIQITHFGNLNEYQFGITYGLTDVIQHFKTDARTVFLMLSGTSWKQLLEEEERKLKEMRRWRRR